MSKTIKLSVAVVGAGAAVLMVVLQGSENAKLKDEARLLRVSLEEAKRAQRAEDRRNPLNGGAKNVLRGDGTVVSHRPGALKEILAIGDPVERVRALLAYAERVRGSDITAVLEELRKDSPDWDFDARMLAHLLLTRWVREDPDAALASIESLHGKKGGQDVASILGALAAYDPQRAAEWMGDSGNNLTHYSWMAHRLAGTIAKEWARQDPDAALSWAARLPEKQRAGAFAGVLGTLAGSDPKRASALALELEPGEARRHVVGEIAEVWARTSPKEASAWARTLEASERQRALRESLESWAQNEPGEAAKYVESLRATENTQHYMTTVAGNWAQRDPVQAAAWVARQPDGDGKADALGHVMWHWTTRDPQAAGEWLGEQPEGPARDRGVTGLAKAAFDFDQESALNWSLTITDDDRRSEMVNHGLREWHGRNPEAAGEWAATNGVEIPAGK